MNEENKKKILLIEDEDDIRALYVEILNDAGYSVFEATDGNSGIDAAREQDWDLLLLDIMLPGQDGVQVLSQMKAESIGTGKPIILLTNLGSEHVINECFKLGADGYLIKSQITPDKIVDEVNVYFKK